MKRGTAELNSGHRIILSARRREKFCLLSTVLITMARRKCVLWNHYAPVKLNKDKVFPHEGQMRRWERSCRQMSKSWGWFSAVWPWCLTQILWFQIYKYMSTPRVCLSPPHLYLSHLPLSLCASMRQTSRAQRSELIKRLHSTSKMEQDCNMDIVYTKMLPWEYCLFLLSSWRGKKDK